MFVGVGVMNDHQKTTAQMGGSLHHQFRAMWMWVWAVADKPVNTVHRGVLSMQRMCAIFV